MPPKTALQSGTIIRTIFRLNEMKLVLNGQRKVNMIGKLLVVNRQWMNISQ